MENAVEALKIAFGVMMFVLALTLSISSFSKANSTVTAIVKMNDRETEYTYVEPSNDLTRTVGVESIVPTMYRAYHENIEIRFFEKIGDNIEPLYLYNKINSQDGTLTSINYIDDAKNSDTQLLDSLLAPGASTNSAYEFIHHVDGGLYNYLSGKQFKEELGEYYQDGNKVKKRVITYTLVSN